MAPAPKDDLALLRDLLKAARTALEHARGLDAPAFHASRLHQDAIIRVVGILGEAAWRITPAFKAAHMGVPWQAMAGMRHRIVHDYAEVDLDVVWRVVTHELPPLIRRIEALVPADEDP